MGPNLTDVTVIDSKEARWDNSKRKDESEGKRCPNSESKKALFRKKKVQNGLSDWAEEFCKGLYISKEEYEKQVWERLCYAVYEGSLCWWL